MATNKEIIFSARDNGVSSTMSKIRQSANDLGRDLMQEAQQKTSSQKDALKYYEDQIRAIERRNSLDAEHSRNQARIRKDVGMMQAGGDPQRSASVMDKYRKDISGISTEKKEADTQVQLLRELIQVTKETHREELKSDSHNTEKEIKSDRSRGVFGGVSTGKESEDKTQSQIQSRSSDSNLSLGARKGGGVGRRMTQGAVSAASSGNAVDMVGQMGQSLLGSPWLFALGGAMVVGVQGMKARAKREKAGEQFGAISGRGLDSIIEDENLLDAGHKYGIVGDDFISKNLTGTARRYGESKGAKRRAIASLQVQRAFGVDDSVTGELESLSRISSSGARQTDQTASRVFAHMQQAGAFKGGDMSRAGDIFSGYSQIRQSNFMRTGELDSGENTLKLMSQLEQSGGGFRHDQRKTSVIQSMDSGLSSGGNDYMTALKRQILMQQNPNLGSYELEAELEKGINAEGLLSGGWDMIKKLSGGDKEGQKHLLDEMFGGQVSKGDINRMVEEGTLDKEVIEGNVGSLDIQGLSDKNISETSKYMAEGSDVIQNTLASVGEGMVSLIKSIEELIEKLNNKEAEEKSNWDMLKELF